MVLKTILQSFVTKFAVAIINLLILLITSRYLGVSSRGEISLFLLNIAIIQILNETYTGYSLIHFIPKFDFKKLFLTGLVFSLFFAVLANTLLGFLNKHIEGSEGLAYFLSILIILNTFHCVLLLGKGNVLQYNFLSLLQPFLLLLAILFWVFVLKEYTFASYTHPLTLSFAISYALSFILVLKSRTTTQPLLPFNFGAILSKGAYTQLTVLMFLFCNRYSYYLLSDSAKVGLYASASTLIESVLIFSYAMAPVLLSRANQTHNSKQHAELCIALLKLSLLFCLSSALFFYLLPEKLYTTILGDGFNGIKYYMMLYVPGVVMMSVIVVLSNYFISRGSTKTVFLCNAAGFILSLALAPGLIRLYSTAGAVYTANIAFTAIACCMSFSFLYLSKITLKQIIGGNLSLKQLLQSEVFKN